MERGIKTFGALSPSLKLTDFFFLTLSSYNSDPCGHQSAHMTACWWLFMCVQHAPWSYIRERGSQIWWFVLPYLEAPLLATLWPVVYCQLRVRDVRGADRLSPHAPAARTWRSEPLHATEPQIGAFNPLQPDLFWSPVVQVKSNWKT